MRLKSLAAAVSVAGLLVATAAHAQGPCFHAVNNFGIWFYSYNSAAEAVSLCQINTAYGGACWYRGYW